MTGITEYAIADIYDYIEKHNEREFLLKFSAMEIYNESVRDLLSTDSSPLRLLDDPKRGTVTEKLTEEPLRDWNNVMELLSICEAQRQIGETTLNETSSKSHQIIRLTIESSARQFLVKDYLSTLTAAVNFVDLAGSERASQSLSVGTRLKEGCHINYWKMVLGWLPKKTVTSTITDSLDTIPLGSTVAPSPVLQEMSNVGPSHHATSQPIVDSDKTQAPSVTQPSGIRTSKPLRVRRPTLGKGIQKIIRAKKGKKCYVHIDHGLNAMTGKYATPATNKLGIQIKSLCPVKDVKSWLDLDETTKSAVIQAVLVTDITCPQDVIVLYKAAIILPTKPLEEQQKKRWKLCRVTDVEETKLTIRMIPLCMTFIFCGVVSSIGNTYFIEQANHMNHKLGKISIPIVILLWFHDQGKQQFANLYYKLANKLGGSGARHYAPLIGIAVSMVFAILCCITAAKVETRRLNVVRTHGLIDKPEDRIPMSVFWLLPQFVLIGALNGILENSIVAIFIDQVGPSMRAYVIHFGFGVVGLGSIGSVLSVYVAGKVSERGGKQSWFQDTLNHSRLDKYYWTLAWLSAVNLGLYIVTALFYRFRKSELEDPQSELEDEDAPHYQNTNAPFKDNARCCC
ncbi:hypothetical protein TEA_009613 [Camellia sinensis var. sinensis]|uniref:Kinesin motor domain-containing protein n=1 Tax=Camellia sinensis var. sinensis TaxID=542762 RepID=A0A4V3WPI5_CAMSN|nr:hypothetical protein TEA_009613 [Camellia sinensis var. sinensis]